MVAQYADAGTNKAGLGVGVAAFYVFLVFFAIGLDAAGWVMLSEIFPNFIRAKGYALAVASQSLADIIYLQVTPEGFANLGWKYFLVSPPYNSYTCYITNKSRRFISLFLQLVSSGCTGPLLKRTGFHLKKLQRSLETKMRSRFTKSKFMWTGTLISWSWKKRKARWNWLES